MAELKPCPFCGGMPIFMEERSLRWEGVESRISVKCYHCGCRTNGLKEGEMYGERTAKEVVERVWNRRVGDGT